MSIGNAKMNHENTTQVLSPRSDKLDLSFIMFIKKRLDRWISPKNNEFWSISTHVICNLHITPEATNHHQRIWWEAVWLSRLMKFFDPHLLKD